MRPETHGDGPGPTRTIQGYDGVITVGGRGSTRWKYPGRKKYTVEQSLILDVNELARKGMFDIPRGYRAIVGVCPEPKSPRGRQPKLINCVTTHSHTGELILIITYTSQGEQMDQVIHLDVTYPNYGGKRFWFKCPTVKSDGELCDKRVGKLYLPPHCYFFLCRFCHALTYESSQQNHKFDGYDAHCRRLVEKTGVSPKVAQALLDQYSDEEITRDFGIATDGRF